MYSIWKLMSMNRWKARPSLVGSSPERFKRFCDALPHPFHHGNDRHKSDSSRSPVFCRKLMLIRILALFWENSAGNKTVAVTLIAACWIHFGVQYCSSISCKTTGLHVTLHKPNAGAESGRDLFKGSKGSATFVVCTRKENFWFRGVVLC